MPEFTKIPITIFIYVKFQLCPQTPIHVYPLSALSRHENFLNPCTHETYTCCSDVCTYNLFACYHNMLCSTYLSIDCPRSSSVTVCVDWLNPPAISADVDQMAKFRVLRFHHSVIRLGRLSLNTIGRLLNTFSYNAYQIIYSNLNVCSGQQIANTLLRFTGMSTSERCETFRTQFHEMTDAGKCWHCVHSLLPPVKSCNHYLRPKGHMYELPRCDSEMHKQSFVPRDGLFKYM